MILLSDPSIHHMTEAIITGIDANPPLFFYLYKLIGDSFSLNPIFLRLVSIFFFALALVLLFRYVNQLIKKPITNFIIITATISLTYINFAHAPQIRSYSVYLLISCLHFIVLNKLIKNPTNLYLLTCYTLTSLGLAFVHNFGLFYIAASLTFFGLLFLWSKQRAYLLVIALGLLAVGVWLIVWFPNFLIQADTGKPYSWIAVPTVLTFFNTVGDLIPTLPVIEHLPVLSYLPILRVLAVAGIFIYITIPKLKRGFAVLIDDSAFSFYALSGFIFLLSPIIAFLVSVTYTSVFLSRYLWPNHLLLIFQFVYIYNYFFSKITFSSKLVKLFAIYCLLITVFLFYQGRKGSLFPSLPLKYETQINKNYPFFFESLYYFLPAKYYNLENAYYWLDWQSALENNGVSDFKIIRSIKKLYNMKEVITIDQFTKSQFLHFYILDDTTNYKFEYLIASKKIRVLRIISVPISNYRILECVQ